MQLSTGLICGLAQNSSTHGTFIGSSLDYYRNLYTSLNYQNHGFTPNYASGDIEHEVTANALGLTSVLFR